MKKFFLLTVFVALTLSIKAAKVIDGSLNCIKGEKHITVTLDCSKAVYRKDRTFQDFLDKAPRIDDWETESLKYFFEYFNDETFKIHLTAVPATSKNKGKYELVLIPLEITKGGGFKKAHACLLNSETKEQMAIIEFETDGDDNDKITLRDPMKEAGEDLGKLFNKLLK